MEYRLEHIPAGEAGTDATVKRITELIHQAKHRPQTRLLAIQILDRAGVTSHNELAAARVLHQWVRNRIRYIRDPLGMETVQAPEVTARIHAGDCDDHATLLAALADSVGLPTRLTVIGPSPDNFQHIYPEIYAAGNWYAADTTVARPFGWRPQMPAKKSYHTNQEDSTMPDLAAHVVPGLTRNRLRAVIYHAATNKLRENWNNGLINTNDVRGYLRVIDEGNSPARGTIAEPPMRQAISDFLSKMSGKVAPKPANTMSGLEGLDGFLKSVFGAVKNVVGAVVKTVTGGGGETVVKIQTPQFTMPPIQTTVPPESARAAVSEGMNSPILWGAVGLAAVGLVIVATR